MTGSVDTECDLSLTEPRFPSTLEKWYIDALCEDGTVLLIYLGRLRLFGFTWARATAEIFLPDGRVIRSSAPVTAIRGGIGQLRFGETAIDGERLAVSIGEVQGELRYHARHGEVLSRDPWTTVGSRRLAWKVEIADADVEGRLCWSRGEFEVRGARGYRDRVFFDLLPWRFPIRKLAWGRAVAGNHAAFWLSAERDAGEGAEPARSTLREAWLDGESVDCPRESAPSAVQLGGARTLLATHVVDLKGLRLGPAKALLRSLTGDPYETKMASSCTIFEASGRAIHERVTWR
jgi:hypothetical protein